MSAGAQRALVVKVREMALHHFTMLSACVCFAMLLSACSGSTDDRSSAATDSRFDDRSPQLLLDVIAVELDVAEEITLCMKAQGFEYSSYSYSRELDRLKTMTRTLGDPVGFAEQFGYGIVEPDHVLPAPDMEMRPPDADFDIALYGRDLAITDPESGPPGGCWGQSLGRALGSQSPIATVYDERERISGLVDQDTEIEQLRTGWSRCMAEHGYSYYSPADAVDYFVTENARLGRASGPANPLDPADFEELFEHEVEAATADLGVCRGDELRRARLAAANRIGWSEEARSAALFLDNLTPTE